MSDRALRLRLIRKKFHDLRIRTKMRLFFSILIAGVVLSVGIASYLVASKELQDNARQTIFSLEKQGVRNLCDRKKSFEESSYRILQMENISRLLYYSREKAQKMRTRNEGLPAAIVQQRSLYAYTRYALLRPDSGMIYDYYKGKEQRLESDVVQDLLDRLDDFVERHHPISWVKLDGVDYFIRQIVDESFEEKGLLVFAVDEEFFDFVGDGISYLHKDNISVYNASGELLKGSGISHRPNYLLATQQSEESGWEIAVEYSEAELLEGVNHIFMMMAVLLALALPICLLITNALSRTMMRNVSRMEYGMEEFERGNFLYRISPSSYDEIGLLGLRLNHMASRIRELIEQVRKQEEEKRQMEVSTLLAQINPHFLYNTLGSLRWMAFREGNKSLAKALEALSKLLRFTIKRAAGIVPLNEEISYISNYVEIEKMRYGDGFEIFYDIEEGTQDILVPGFILQPMVENSLLHGLDMTKSGGRIRIKTTMEKDKDGRCLVIEESDNGIGMTEEKRQQILNGVEKEKTDGFSSIGMNYVNKRLKEIYKEGYCMEIVSAPDEGVKITLRIPMEETYET